MAEACVHSSFFPYKESTQHFLAQSGANLVAQYQEDFRVLISLLHVCDALGGIDFAFSHALGKSIFQHLAEMATPFNGGSRWQRLLAEDFIRLLRGLVNFFALVKGFLFADIDSVFMQGLCYFWSYLELAQKSHVLWDILVICDLVHTKIKLSDVIENNVSVGAYAKDLGWKWKECFRCVPGMVSRILQEHEMRKCSSTTMHSSGQSIPLSLERIRHFWGLAPHSPPLFDSESTNLGSNFQSRVVFALNDVAAVLRRLQMNSISGVDEWSLANMGNHEGESRCMKKGPSGRKKDTESLPPWDVQEEVSVGLCVVDVMIVPRRCHGLRWPSANPNVGVTDAPPRYLCEVDGASHYFRLRMPQKAVQKGGTFCPSMRSQCPPAHNFVWALNGGTLWRNANLSESGYRLRRISFFQVEKDVEALVGELVRLCYGDQLQHINLKTIVVDALRKQ